MGKTKKKVKPKPQEKKQIKWGKIFWYTFLGVIIILFIVNNLSKDEGPVFQYPPGTKKNLYEKDVSTFPEAFDFKLKTLDNKELKLSDFKGKVVVLDFWATWCPPCRKGIPDLIEIQKSMKDVQVIGISVDENPQKVIPDFVKEFKINYPIVIGNDEVYNRYGGIEAIPTTFIIDRQGKIRNKHVGLVEKEILIAEIKRALQS